MRRPVSPNGMRYAPNGIRTRGAKKETGYEEAKQQQADHDQGRPKRNVRLLYRHRFRRQDERRLRLGSSGRSQRAVSAADERNRLSDIFHGHSAQSRGGGSRRAIAWVSELVERCGHQVYVSNTRKVPYIHESDDKNDSGDAYKLAELVHLKPRLLHPIQHRSQEAQADLSWIRAREVLVESRTQMLNAVRGMSKA